MRYNFDEVLKRKGTNSVKWDSNIEDILPMWIADMDFKIASPITEAMKKIAEQEIYGYSTIPEEYYEAVCSWFENIHSWRIDKKWIIYTTGVVPILGLLVRIFIKPGDKVIIQTPIYQHFYKAISDNGGEIIQNSLKLDSGRYFMDFEDLERKASDENTKLLILCNPHNPTGRVWSKDELVRLSEICKKHGILVVSDEIHCDLIYKEHKHIPFSLIDETSNFIICTAPSKTFNLAALKISNIIIPNEVLRHKVNKVVAIAGLGRVNIFAVEATIAAYKYGDEWYYQLLEYLFNNVNYIIKFFQEKLPIVNVIKPEGTYLVWIDCRRLNVKKLEEFFLKEAKVRLNDGSIFGNEGEGFVRINVACPRSVLREGLERIEKAVKAANLDLI